LEAREFGTVLVVRLDQFDCRDPIKHLDLMSRVQRNRLFSVTHNVKHASKSLVGDVDWQRLFVEGIDVGINHRCKKPIKGDVRGVAVGKSYQFLLQGFVGVEAVMLRAQPTVQPGHVPSPVRERTSNYIHEVTNAKSRHQQISLKRDREACHAASSSELNDASFDNVYHYCATVLPFRSEGDIDAWSRRHAIPRGAVVPIAQVAELARLWYGKHADRDWKKWSVAQAREIFEQVGLTGPFWDLEPDEGGEPF
jgi:hypothetical protein